MTDDNTSNTEMNDDHDIEPNRLRLRSLILANPNYFGTFPESGFKAVELIASNTNYEELTSLGYNTKLKQLHATFDIKRSTGYSGGLCTDGSREFVRFYVDFGGGWVDVGLAGAVVHDIPAGRDCARRDRHPLSYTVEVEYSPSRRWCVSPQLPRVRAILSWNVQPPAGSPDWKPVYGSVEECSIQIDKSPFFIDFLDHLHEKFDIPLEILESAKPYLPVPVPGVPEPPEFLDIGVIPEPPIPNPPSPLSAIALAEQYGGKELSVEPSRFAFAEVQALRANPSIELSASSALAAGLGQFGVDLGKLVFEIEDTTGNIDYEELVDVGLDYHREKLVATYHVKKQSGFSGGLCTAGSTEYVSFWADYGDNCSWDYLDTVSLKAYDFVRLPDGGLCYSVSLPVDVDEFKRRCVDPQVARVRAVLSWNTPPSNSDPDDVPTWGNRLDAHVLLPPRSGVPGSLSVVGGVKVSYISDVDGMAAGNAVFALTGSPVYSPLGDPVPFGARVRIEGAPVVGKRYRLHVVDASLVSQTLTKKVWITPQGPGFGSWHSPDANGWFDYKSTATNKYGVLGYFDSTGNDLVTIKLEIEGSGIVDEQKVQLDNVWPDVSVSITDPVGDCGTVESGVTMTGRVDVFDLHLGQWWVEIDGGPAGFGPVSTTTGATGTANTPAGGAQWTFDTATANGGTGLEPCGYIARVIGWDRAIVNSGGSQHRRSTDIGFCVKG